MAKECNCMSAEVKTLLQEGFQDPELNKLLAKVPECKDGAPLKMCGSGRGGKRAPSAYNEFVGSCMKSGKAMRDCAVEWKAKKG